MAHVKWMAIWALLFSGIAFSLFFTYSDSDSLMEDQMADSVDDDGEKFPEAYYRKEPHDPLTENDMANYSPLTRPAG